MHQLAETKAETMKSVNVVDANSKPHQKCVIRSMKAFVGLAGLVMCAQMALAIYTKSVLTSIEKRFEISSSLAGFIVGSFNIGNLLFVVVVSQLSSKRHRPRIMATGSMLIAFGGFINFIPHLINQPYLINYNSQNTTILNKSSDFTAMMSHPTRSNNTSSSHLYLVLVFGEILQGIGSTVHIPLSSSYIDDFASKENSPVYLGISFVFQNIGPGFGYLIGSWTSKYYVDFDRIDEDQIPEEKSGNWVGAWWLGYLIISAWVVLAALPLYFFPKTMRTNNQSFSSGKSQESADSDNLRPIDYEKAKFISHVGNSNLPNDDEIQSNVETIRFESTNGSLVESTPQLSFCEGFALTIRRLLTNSVYVSVTFGYAGLMFVVGTLTAFMPKFLEEAYNKTPASVNLLFGLTLPPVLCLGLLMGGIIAKKLLKTLHGMLRFAMVCASASLLPIFLCFFLTCDTTTCDEVSFVFGNDSNSSAGVQSSHETCVNSRCDVMCIVFVIVMSFAAFLAACLVTPIYTVVLRSVHPDDKCTSIGVMFLIIRVFGLVPAPIITGAAIDSTCLIWNGEEDGTTNCVLHNISLFRTRYMMIIACGILCCLLFNVLAYIFLRHKTNKKSRVSIALASLMRRLVRKTPSTQPSTNEHMASNVYDST